MDAWPASQASKGVTVTGTPDYGQTSLSGGPDKGKVGFARGRVVGLDEIESVGREVRNRTLRRLGGLDQSMKRGIGRAVENRTGADDARAKELAGIDAAEHVLEDLRIGAEITDPGDSLGHQKP